MKKLTKKVAKKTTKKQDTKDPAISVSAEISLFGKKYVGQGVNVNEAIEGIKPVGFTKVRSVLTVNNNGLRREKILTPMMTYRLFSQQKLMRQLAMKNLIAYFK